MSDISIPRLTMLSKSDIVLFKKEYQEYTRAVEAYNRGRPRAQRINIRQWSECVDNDLLEELRVDLESRQPEDPDEEWEFEIELRNFLDNIIVQDSFEIARITLQDAIATVSLNPKVIDHKARVINFKASLRTVLRENGLDPSEIFTDASKFGKIVKLLVDTPGCLNPPEVRAWIRHILEGEARGKMTADQLTDTLESKCEQVHAVKMMKNLSQHYGYVKRHLPKSQRPSTPNNNSSKGHLGKRQRHDKGDNRNPKTKHPKLDRNANPSSDRTAGPTKKVVKCWGCGLDGHSLRECSLVTSESERQKIVDEKRQQRKSNKSQSNQYIGIDNMTCKQIGTYLTELMVKINKIECKVILDDGSDRSLVSRIWIDRFQRQHNFSIEKLFLDEQRQIQLADQATHIHTECYVRLSLTFHLYDNLNLRNRQFFVVDEDIGYPIIGHSELEELGIDPKSTLQRMQYSDSANDDLDPMQEDEIVEEGPVSIELAIEQMLNRARQSGMPTHWWKKLCNLVWSYKDIFRVSLENDPAAEVTPMDVSFKPGKENYTWRTHNRKYTSEELKWLKNHLKKLEEYDLVYRNPHARYASPALVIPKPGRSGEYRLCVDVKIPNSMVMDTHWPMPVLDALLRKLSGSAVFAKLDAFKGYWLFPVTPKCGELYSIQTPFGIFTPRRIVQGSKEAVRYFQAGMEEALSVSERSDLLIWIDDILTHSATCQGLLESLSHCFRCCRNHKIRLSARKCDLFLESVTWCGRQISSKGIGYDPQYIQGLIDLDFPETVGDLQQYICSLNWMRSTIPHYNREMEPLQNCLKDIVSKIGSNKKKVLARRQLSNYIEWDDVVRNSFLQTKELLKKSIISTHYDPQQRLSVFPDASDKHWGLFITQVPREDLNLPYEDQRHSPILMKSGSFKGSSSSWHIKEKEAYPILVALDKARDLLKNPDGFSLFTDHKNLVWILDPERRKVVKNADDRLTRWSLSLMSYRFSVEHISGEDNVVADMLSRWRIEYPQTVCGASFRPGQCSTMHKKDFVWPDLNQIARLQGRLTDSDVAELNLTPNTISGTSLLTTKSGRIFVPDSEDLRVRLCVIAHCGSAGHRGIQQTFKILKKFYWPKMLPDVKNFCRQCIHCSVADPRKVIPRPLGMQMHAQTRNQILHYDFMHVGKSSTSESYLLVIKDDFSSFVNLIPCSTPTSDVVVKALLNWYSLFGVSLTHISDQGSHFKNKVVAELNRRLSTKHHFTLPYTPWSNGTIEIVNKSLRKLIRVWISEFRIDLSEWPSLIPLMTHVLNFSVSPRLGFPPAMVFGGFKTKNSVESIFTNSSTFRSSKLNFADLSAHVKDLQESLELLHRQVKEKTTRRGNHSLLRNRPNFSKGDFVMFATRHNGNSPSRRSRPCWTGPYRVLDCLSDWEFEIQHLVTLEKFSAHCSRLKYYCDKDLNITADLKYQITHDELRYKVKRFVDHAKVNGEFQLLTEWLGFDEEDSSWEPLSTLLEDVPDMCRNYVLNLPEDDKFRPLLSAVVLPSRS